MTTDIAALEAHLDPNGDTPLSLSIITKPYGYIACIGVISSWVFNYMFSCWSSKACAAQLKVDEQALDRSVETAPMIELTPPRAEGPAMLDV